MFGFSPSTVFLSQYKYSLDGGRLISACSRDHVAMNVHRIFGDRPSPLSTKHQHAPNRSSTCLPAIPALYSGIFSQSLQAQQVSKKLTIPLHSVKSPTALPLNIKAIGLVPDVPPGWSKPLGQGKLPKRLAGAGWVWNGWTREWVQDVKLTMQLNKIMELIQ
jgi:hypothetical protein